MQKSVNKLMYYPLRDDIPNGNLLMSKARPMTNATSLRGLTMKLYRHTMNYQSYYTTSPDIAQSDYLVRRDPTVGRRGYTVSRRRSAINGVAPQWEWQVIYDSPNLNDARDFITADRINPQ